MMRRLSSFQNLVHSQVPWTDGASGSSGIGTDTFSSVMISLGTSGTLKILILFTIKKLEDVQDTSKSRQRIHGYGTSSYKTLGGKWLYRQGTLLDILI